MTNKELLDKIRNEILHLKMKELQRTNGVNTGADVYLSSYAVLSILSNALTEESEDERIRKWLIDYFSSIKATVWIHRDITCEQILEWLEKQKEPENTSASTMAPSCWEVEQKEQKPAEWSEEDEEMIEHIVGSLILLKCYVQDNSVLKRIKLEQEWLKSLRPSWKPSEEQIHIIGLSIANLQPIGHYSLFAELDDLKKELEKLRKINPSKYTKYTVMKIKAIIEKGADGLFSIYSEDHIGNSYFGGFGETEKEAIKDFKQSVIEAFENNLEIEFLRPK